MKKWPKRVGIIMLLGLCAWIWYAQTTTKFRMPDEKALREFKEAGVALSIHTIDANGFSLHYVQVGNDTMPTLFLVHGSPGGWIKFKRFLKDKELLRKYRMIAIDRPGFGYSQFGTVRNLQQQSEIISVLLKQIRNGKPVYAAGRSYGGPLIARLAVDNPDYFSGLVFIAAAMDPRAEKPEKWRPVFFKSPLKYLLPGAWKQSNEELWYLKKELYPLEMRLDAIHCPIYVLHGTGDGLVPVSNADYIKKKLVNAASISVTIIPGANHFVSDHHYDLVKSVFLKLY